MFGQLNPFNLSNQQLSIGGGGFDELSHYFFAALIWSASECSGRSNCPRHRSNTARFAFTFV